MQSNLQSKPNTQAETADGEKLPSKSRRGFASMSPEKRRAIAANGGRALRPEMRAFSKNRDLAAAAGRKSRPSVRKEGRDV